jgi:hypothetical protein
MQRRLALIETPDDLIGAQRSKFCVGIYAYGFEHDAGVGAGHRDRIAKRADMAQAVRDALG